MSIIKNIVLPLIAAAAMFVNNAGADDQPLVLPAGLFADDAAMRAWENTDFGPAQGEVSFNGMPVTEIVKRVTGIYKNRFDVILPGAPIDPSTVDVTLELRNVRPVEIFNAMNMYWEATKVTVCWKLTLNGSRPTAVLEENQIPPSPAAGPAPPPQAEIKASVFSIANLINSSGKLKDPTFIAESIAGVLAETSSKPGGGGGEGDAMDKFMNRIRIHEEAGLLVFTGTPEQIELVRSTLEAMKQTVLAQEPRPGSIEETLKELKKIEADTTNQLQQDLKK